MPRKKMQDAKKVKQRRIKLNKNILQNIFENAILKIRHVREKKKPPAMWPTASYECLSEIHIVASG